MNDTVERDGLTVTIIETPNLGDRSYVIDDGHHALVVDPQRDIDRVQAVLEDRGVQLAAVAETHVHNDYVSGGLELARRSGAAYLVPSDAQVSFARTEVSDDDMRTVGTMTVRTIATPGHTHHHVAFAVGIGGTPAFVFTGGSMLFGAVGRTDLIGTDATLSLTRAQHASVRRLARDLPADTAVLPTHGFGSFCSATPTSGTASTIEEQREQNPALTQEEDAFVETLLAGFDAYPAYYAQMGPINSIGAGPIDLSPAAEADATEVRRRIDAGEWVVDLRARTAFARGHVPGTYSFDATENLVTYLGWLIPWGTPLNLIGTSPEQVADVQRELVRIGIDRPAAQTTAPIERLLNGQPLANYRTATFAELAQARQDGTVQILDVRRDTEWQESHLGDAQHIPLHDLPLRVDDVSAGPVWVHCASGFRASIAASLLDAAGKDVIVVDDDFDHAHDAGLPISKS